jgi:hypothetical protein
MEPGFRRRDLARITHHLKSILRLLDSPDLRDSRIMSSYAEYLVAYELTKHGHHLVQMLGERDQLGADIWMPKKGHKNGGIGVEVKSGRWQQKNKLPMFSCASFRKGNQIRDGKFDFCVFAPYDELGPTEFLVFARRELSELSKASKERKGFAKHEKTNPCLLVRCHSYDDLKEVLRPVRPLRIEKRLHRNEREFRNQWRKIVDC